MVVLYFSWFGGFVWLVFLACLLLWLLLAFRWFVADCLLVLFQLIWRYCLFWGLDLLCCGLFWVLAGACSGLRGFGCFVCLAFALWLCYSGLVNSVVVL